MTKRQAIYRMLFTFVLIVSFSATAYGEMNQKKFNEMFNKYLATDEGQEALGKSVETYFKDRQKRARKQQEEKAKAEMEKQFANPVKIPIGTSPVKGPKNAKVTIVEFSEFQCPYCKKVLDTTDKIAKAYPNDVNFVFKHLPLGFHKNAEPAAKASIAAGKQGKFWEMHDLLFENNTKLTSDLYVDLAKKLELDVDKFKKDMESEETAKQLKDDKELADKHGIRGTPGFFVNGVAVKGAYPYEHFKKIIDRWLKGKA